MIIHKVSFLDFLFVKIRKYQCFLFFFCYFGFFLVFFFCLEKKVLSRIQYSCGVNFDVVCGPL